MADENEPQRDELYAHMNKKETDELVEIYQENDVEGRTEESLEIVRQILLERLGELPDEEDDEDTLAEEELEFPKDKVLYRIADWSSRLSGWILGVAIITIVLKLHIYFTYTLPPSAWEGVRIFELVITVLNYLGAVLYAGFLYLVLKAVTEIIYTLIDIRDLFQATEKVDGEPT